MRLSRTPAAILLTAFFATATTRAQPWETIPNCRLVESNYNDGDSFHVRAAGKERIFRLYFVDTAETSNDFKRRTSDQAKDFDVRKKRLLELGREATAFSAAKLTGNFTVRTKWEDAEGQSQLPRHFAVIETPEGDLAELLVAAGLARIHGHHIAHPRGISADSYQHVLENLEAKAKAANLGAWTESATPTAPTRAKAKEPARESPPTTTLKDIPAF